MPLKMQLPKSVIDAKAKSEELRAKLQAGETLKPDGTTAKKATPEKDDKDTSLDQAKKPEDTPKETENFEAKYLSLKGKYDAEVPRLTHENSNLQNSLSQMNLKIEQLEKAINEKPKDQVLDTPKLNAERLQAYGEEFGDVATIIENMQNKIDAYEKKFSDIEAKAAKIDTIESTQKVTAETSRNNFLSNVEAQVNEMARAKGLTFAQLNATPGESKAALDFQNWLAQRPDANSPSRFDNLRRADGAMDVNGTIKIFQEYLGGNNKPPDEKHPPNLQPDPGPGGDPVPQKSTKVWTREGISRLYTDKANGNITDEEFEVHQKDLFLAQQEGRVA